MIPPRTIIYDLETDGLYQQVTEVHCGVCYLVEENKYYSFTSRPLEGSNGTIEDLLLLLSSATTIIAHNGISFDQPVLNKLHNWTPSGEVIDTFLISQLKFTNLAKTDAFRKTIPAKLKGRHSLEAWGYRLRILKGDFGKQENAWEVLTDSMLAYCKQDVAVLAKLWQHFNDKGLPPKEAIWLEQEFAKVISRQEKYGVYFDLEKADKLHHSLLLEAVAAEEALEPVFKPLDTWTPKNYPSVYYKKDGTKSQNALNHEILGCHYNDNLEWGYYKKVVFNPTSRQNVARWLMEVYSWQPTEFTEKGGIIINDAVLEGLDFPEGKILAHYFVVKKLIGMLAEGKGAWMKHLTPDNRIHGRVNTLGAVTRRCTHSSPNMAQVPSGKSYKGHEARELFTVPKGKRLVGCDADGLELRTLSHYMAKFDGGAYARAVDSGDKEKGTDVHTLNQKGAGLPTRDDAKTFIYAFLYGAGDAKIGSIVNGSAEDGKQLKAKFLRQFPALQRLSDKVANTYKATGALKALDGNPYLVRSSHSALNTLLQGAGALVMKYYLVFLDQNLQEEFTFGKQYEFVLNVHDEVQIECDEEVAGRVAELAEEAFDQVTDYLQFRIPLRGTAAIGKSWADTH